MLNEQPAEKKITLLVDLEFCYDQVEGLAAEEIDDVGFDLKPFDGLHPNVLLAVAFDGHDGGQLDGIAGTEEIRDEFLRFCSFTADACGMSARK